jgi:hypothetical protein
MPFLWRFSTWSLNNRGMGLGWNVRSCFSLTAHVGAKNKHQFGFGAFITMNYKMLSNKEMEIETSENKEQRYLHAILSFLEAISVLIEGSSNLSDNARTSQYVPSAGQCAFNGPRIDLVSYDSRCPPPIESFRHSKPSQP